MKYFFGRRFNAVDAVFIGWAATALAAQNWLGGAILVVFGFVISAVGESFLAEAA